MWYEIFKFELQYRARRLDTYLFFNILFLGSLVSFNFIFEGHNLGFVKENAPYVTAKIMAVMSGVFMLITSMIMGVPILRDFEYNFSSLLFTTPITKRDYLIGRFLGSFVVLVFIFSGLIWGIIFGELLPWRAEENLLAFTIAAYLNPFLTIVLPNLFFGGSIFFVSGTLSRNLIVVYTQGILFFILFVGSRKIADPVISAILDPFAFTAIGEVIQQWSIVERNARLLPMEGVLLYNRIFWLLIGVLALIIGYSRFNFTVQKGKNRTTEAPNTLKKSVFSAKISLPTVTLQDDFKARCFQLKAHSIFYFQSIFKEVSFWSILLCAVAIIFINSVNLGTAYGVNSYPTTYLIVEELQENTIFLFLLILVFYSGDLIWKEQDVQFNEIYDVLPVSNFLQLASKFIGLVFLYLVLLSVLIIAGIFFQTLNGYYRYELPVYFRGFFLEFLPFLIRYTFISFFIQVLANSKYIGHVLVVLFFFSTLALDQLGYGCALYNFGGISLGKYSDMNGYGHYLKPYLCFEFYWLTFSFLLFVLTVIFNNRGTETSFKVRWKLSKQRLSVRLIKGSLAMLLVFISMGIYIFYNTNILNSYWSPTEKQALRAGYEKTLKKFESLAQAKIVGVNLTVDLYPKNRDYSVEGYYMLTNPQEEPITSIDVQQWINPKIVLDYVKFEGGASLIDDHYPYHYYRYQLKQPLFRGDSIKMSFKQTLRTQGFVESGSNTRIIHNGTFLGSYYFPSLGYNKRMELKDREERAFHDLLPRINLPKRNAQAENKNESLIDNGIDFEIVIGTDSSQIAVAPGTLQKEWIIGNRKYFHYKMSERMINFYAIVSARYEVLQDTWKPLEDSLAKSVALEIYYHKGHEYNLERMMEAMKMSLTYYSTQFSSYPYQQMRIMEFPRYESFAQAFPTTVPFSEAIGFVLDIDEEKDVDMAFYITAHEVAHQWWGLQLIAAEVKGKHLILESLAQYSALMVLQQKYPEKKVQQFLHKELETYLKRRTADAAQEVPLSLVEGQDYIYYRKGAINLYALQDYITEDSVNIALKRFLQDWNSFDTSKKQYRYATSADLLTYFSKVTPDSLQYLIADLFETVTLYDNKTLAANCAMLPNGQYQVNVEVEAIKYRMDSTGVESSIQMNDWIDIGVYTLDAEGVQELIYLKKHRIAADTSVIEIIVEQLPSQVGVDPLYRLIDKNVENNMLMVAKE